MTYKAYPTWVIGFHGCDKMVFDKVIKENIHLTPSTNQYDWLGHGAYFWENNPLRAYEFALEQKQRGRINEPKVIGAFLDLGRCLDLTDMYSLVQLRSFFPHLKADCEARDKQLPKNKIVKNGEILFRNLDCAMIEFLHSTNESISSDFRNQRHEDASTASQNLIDQFRPYDSVRGAFIEGEPLYPGAALYEKNHIQICIRNTQCIKGYFNPLIDVGKEYTEIRNKMNIPI